RFRVMESQDACLSIQHGCEAPPEVLPTDMKVEAKVELNKKAHSVVILCLSNKVLRKFIEETTTTGVWTKLDTGEEVVYILHLRESSRSKPRGGRLKCYVCQSEDHLKRNYPKNNRKRSTSYVKKYDQPISSGSVHDGFGVMMLMSAEALLERFMDLGGSYHMTPKLDLLFEFLKYDGGSVLLGDNRE
nr:zinc finger, CCHC-type [Tanacetum cinerariifolium]